MAPCPRSISISCRRNSDTKRSRPDRAPRMVASIFVSYMIRLLSYTKLDTLLGRGGVAFSAGAEPSCGKRRNHSAQRCGDVQKPLLFGPTISLAA